MALITVMTNDPNDPNDDDVSGDPAVGAGADRGAGGGGHHAQIHRRHAHVPTTRHRLTWCGL